LSEIAETIRQYHRETQKQPSALRDCGHLKAAKDILGDRPSELISQLKQEIEVFQAFLKPEIRKTIAQWEDVDGDRVRAQQDPGRVDDLRGQKAHR
jgi:methylmalonyl-CoA mutase